MSDPTLRNQTFVDERLDLTGRVVIGCVFDGCVLEVNTPSPGEPFAWIEGCWFKDCDHVGDGWPKPVLVVDVHPQL